MDHHLGADQLALHEIRLTPNVELVVQIDLPPLYSQQLELMNLDGRARIYFTLDGSKAIVAGPRSYVAPAAMTSVQLQLMNMRGKMRSLEVRLISVGDPLISITRPQALDEGSPVT